MGAGSPASGRAEAAVRELLIAVGENPDRSGLADTPARVARAYRELEAEGVVAGRRRLGTVVTGKQVESGVEVALAARALVERARAAGLPDSAVLDLVAGLLRSP